MSLAILTFILVLAIFFSWAILKIFKNENYFTGIAASIICCAVLIGLFYLSQEYRPKPPLVEYSTPKTAKIYNPKTTKQGVPSIEEKIEELSEENKKENQATKERFKNL